MDNAVEDTINDDDDAGFSGELKWVDNSDHVTELIEPQMIDMIMNKPEFAFLKRYYSLLYQSLIPNCKLSINRLRQHISISDNIEQYILGAGSHRTSCQRLLNFLLTHLNSEKNYIQFFRYFKIITVMTELPTRLLSEFHHHSPTYNLQHSNCHNNTNSPYTTTSNDSAVKRCNVNEEAPDDSAVKYCNVNEEAPDESAVMCYTSDHYHHCQCVRRRYITVETTATDKCHQQPSLRFLNRYVRSAVCMKWYYLGIKLLDSNDVGELNAIKVKHPSDLNKCCNRMFDLWLNKQPTASWNQLIEALRQAHIELGTLANKIEQMLLQPKPQDSASTIVPSSPSLVLRQQSVSCVSQASNCRTNIIDTHAIISSSSVTTFSVVECLTTSSSVVTSVSGQYVSVIPAAAGLVSTVVPPLPQREQNSILVSQPSSCGNMSDIYTSSLMTTLSVVACSTTTSSVVASISGQDVSLITTTAVATVEHELPHNLQTNKDFTTVKAHYHSILQLMPDDYEPSVGKLQNYFNDDQICTILGSSNSAIANREILDCLIERMTCKEDLLDLCDQLEKIITSHDLNIVVNEIRTGVQQSMHHTVDTTDTQSLSDQQHDSSMNSYWYQEMISNIQLDSNSKVLAVIKKYYTRLCHCLPQDYKKSFKKLREITGSSTDEQSIPMELPTADLYNEAIIAVLISEMALDRDALKFWDILRKMVDNNDSSITNFVSFKDEILEAINSTSPTPTVMGPNTSTTVSHGSAMIVQPMSSVPLVRPSGNRMTQPQQGSQSSKDELEKIRYKSRQLQKGFRYQQPPPLPSDHVPRQSLLDEIKTKLLQATTLPKKCETTLTITGAAGFGKTTTAISLCHDPVIKEHFTDGFLFIELGSKSTDPTVKLKAIYKLLSNEQCDIYAIEQKISQHTSEYHRNLLIIIDDVWHVEDAEPLVKAFSNCTTILTTRMNDIEQYIPCKSSVTIGPMTQSEAVCLLTSRDTDSSKLSREDVSLLDELAQDVHLWPLLLCLIRGQLSHYVKQRRLSYHKAIENVQAKLHQRGLTAFDKNNINIKATKQSRKFAVKFCIEISLELLAKTLSDKLKTLILYGFDTSLQTAVLSNLWNISEVEADDTVNNLWSYGLVQFTDKITDIIISPNNIIQHYVQVHAVISEYIIESIDSNESYALSPHGGISYTAQSVLDGLLLMYQEIYGVDDMKLLTSIDFLKYKLSETESVVIPFYLQSINMHVVMDPLTIIKTLEETKGVLTTSKTLSSSCAEINSLLTDCKQLLNDAYKLCKTLNQRVQRSIHEKSYDKLIQTLEEWIKNYRLFIIAKKADDIINKIISCCNENQKLLHYIRNSQQYLTVFLPEYHQLKTFALPQIKFCINLCQRINGSLLNGSPDVQLTYYYFWSDKCNEDLQSLSENHLSKIQKVAPNIVEKRRLQEQSQSH